MAAEQSTPDTAPADADAQVWLSVGTSDLTRLAEQALIVRAQIDPSGQYLLEPEQSAILRQAAYEWIEVARHDSERTWGDLLSSSAGRDQAARRVVAELVSAAQQVGAPAWATCLPNGRPVIISATHAGQADTADDEPLVRALHHQALRTLRKAGLDYDAKALAGYEIAQEVPQ